MDLSKTSAFVSLKNSIELELTFNWANSVVNFKIGSTIRGRYRKQLKQLEFGGKNRSPKVFPFPFLVLTQY